MPQTETVIRQALKEKVKPVLFINKVDRLIAELQVTPEDMMQRFGKIITEVNKLISRMVPDEFKKDWMVDAQAGTVALVLHTTTGQLLSHSWQKRTLTSNKFMILWRRNNEKNLPKRLLYMKSYLI